MAKIIVSLRIDGANSTTQAVSLAQEIIAMLQTRLRGTPHTVEEMVQIPCSHCGHNLTVERQEIVCRNPDCLEAQEERAWHEFAMEVCNPRDPRGRRREPEQALEALLA